MNKRLFSLLPAIAAALLGSVGFAVAVRAQNPPAKPAAPVAPKTEIHLATKRDIAPGPSIRLYLNTRNLATVSVAVYKLDTARWLRERVTNTELSAPAPMPTPLPPGKPVRVLSVTVGDPKLKPSAQQPDIYRSKQFNLPTLPPGAYLLVASNGDKKVWSVVNVTNLAVVVKRSPGAVLTWVTDYQTGKPVAGAQVTLWNHKGTQVITKGTTRADGVCQFPAALGEPPILIVERALPGKPSDLAGMAISGISPDGRLVSHLQTDRPVYRPGATMQYRAILRRTRGNAYLPEANRAVTAEVRDSRDNVLQRTSETTNAMGTLAGSFIVPAQGVLGPYSLVLTTADNAQAYATFSVAEYRKPEFKAVVTPDKSRYLSGETAQFSLQTDYYFGAPLAGASVRYVVRRSPMPFYGMSFDDPADSAWYASGDGNLYSRDTYSADEVVADSQVTTDAKGHAVISFPTRNDIGDAQYSITCTVTDGQRRQITAGSSVPVYAANIRLGLRTKTSIAPLNAVVPLELRIADLDNRPMGGKVTILTRQQEWDEKKGTNVWHNLSESTAVVPASGKATTQIPAAKQGDVEIRATVIDSTGRKAIATTSLYVMDPDAEITDEEQEPTVTVRLEHPSYQPGETAKIFLTANTLDRPILLTVEGDAVFAYTVVPPGKSGFTWTVPTTLAMSPNAHVTASQWGHQILPAKKKKPAKPALPVNVHLVGANIPLPVPDRSRRLALTVTPDKTAHRPGETAVYTIQAKDGKTGKPVAGAEVALAVIDESIFAVRPDATPDPYGVFWGLRQNFTQTQVSAPEEVSGGAYQRSDPNGVAPVREKFLDTAYWNAHVITGADGTASARVELPGNLTSWRATALGVTESTAVGRAVASITSSRPVMLRLAPPRQFVQEDILTLIGTISNRTDRERKFEATLNATGVVPAPGESATQSVTIPAKSEAKVEWKVAATIPTPDGRATLEGTLIATDRAANETLSDFSDRVRVSVPVRPHGVATRLREATAIGSDGVATINLDLPTDRIEPATDLMITLRGGAAAAARSAAPAFYRGDTYGTLSAANFLLVAATPGTPAPADLKMVRDALAQLSRCQTPQGSWGWWEDAPADARITARVLRALRALKDAPNLLPPGVPFPDNLLQRGINGGEQLYNQTGLWEERAYLAAVRAESRPHITEVADRNAGSLSPAATMMLAKGLLEAGDKARASQLAQTVLEQAVIGPDAAYIPAGDRPGQRSGVIETTAATLETLVALGENVPLQAKLARWLILPSDGDSELSATPSEQADTIRALLLYARARGTGADSGNLMPNPDNFTVTVNGTAVPWATRAPGTESIAPLTISVPRDLLKDGANTITLRRTGSNDEAFISAEATVYRPQEAETAAGMRVLRRYEAQNAFGVWGEVLPGVTKIQPSSSVRVTVIVWPNETADAIRVVEPLPAGFEVVDTEQNAYAREEVRDGAILHYLQINGAEPVTFRYYLRAEAEGTLTALPASGELIRRPVVRGGSAAQTLEVREAAPAGAKP